MSATATLETLRHAPAGAGSVQRMVVAWRDPRSRSVRPVGILQHDSAGYSFGYIEAVQEIEGFRPLLGFRDFYVTYQQPDLFHLFAQRVMSASRPDYGRYLSELGLASDDDEPWEQLARSYGTRAIDRLQLFPVPTVIDGSVACRFLVHGTRYAGSSVEEALSGLQRGSPLRLIDEPDNPVTDRAVIVAGGSQRIGWVPDLLVDELHRLQEVTSVEADVVQVNGPSAPPHLRVLAELRAVGAQDFEFFAGPRWQLLARA